MTVALGRPRKGTICCAAPASTDGKWRLFLGTEKGPPYQLIGANLNCEGMEISEIRARTWTHQTKGRLYSPHFKPIKGWTPNIATHGPVPAYHEYLALL